MTVSYTHLDVYKRQVSIAHTTANYDQAKAAFAAGASHVTHLFNAMPPFAHRDPGVVGAASDYARHVEMISDGVHPVSYTHLDVYKRQAPPSALGYGRRSGHFSGAVPGAVCVCTACGAGLQQRK